LAKLAHKTLRKFKFSAVHINAYFEKNINNAGGFPFLPPAVLALIGYRKICPPIRMHFNFVQKQKAVESAAKMFNSQSV